MISDREIKRISEKGYAVVVLAEHLGALAVVRELGKQKIPSIVIGSKFIQKSKFTTVSLKANTLCEILKHLNQLPSLLKVKLILFTDSDQYLSFIYNNWEQLVINYLIPASKNNLQLIDKEQLAYYAEHSNIIVPKTFHDLESIGNNHYPVILKPLVYHSAKEVEKAYICYQQGELLQKVIYLKQCNVPFIIQQLVEGNADTIYNLLLYRGKNGRILVGFCTKKLRSFPLQFGTGCAQIAEINKGIIEQSKQLLKDTNYVGLAEFEYKYCEKSKHYFLIEVNGRFTLQSGILQKVNPLFIVSLCRDLLEESTDEFVPTYLENNEIVWLFLLNDIRAIKAENLKLLIPIYLNLLCTKSIQGALWSILDPIPTFYYAKYIFDKRRERQRMKASRLTNLLPLL